MGRGVLVGFGVFVGRGVSVGCGVSVGVGVNVGVLVGVTVLVGVFVAVGFAASVAAIAVCTIATDGVAGSPEHPTRNIANKVIENIHVLCMLLLVTILTVSLRFFQISFTFIFLVDILRQSFLEHLY